MKKSFEGLNNTHEKYIEGLNILNEGKMRLIELGYPKAAEALYSILVVNDRPAVLVVRRERISTFVDRLIADKDMRDMLEKHYKRFGLLIFDTLIKGGSLDSKFLDFYGSNMETREDEYRRMVDEFDKRMMTNPMAMEEELLAGRYREQLESQVRDAVFVLIQKGYRPFESGFDDLIDGSQYVGLFKDDGLRTMNIVSLLSNSLEKYNITVKVEPTHLDDRDQLILVPGSRKLSLDDWKAIWDLVASLMPQISEPRKNLFGALQFSKFDTFQDCLSRKEDAYFEWWAYLDGKMQKIPRDEFDKRVEQKKASRK